MLPDNGSTASASWEKRPMSRIGDASLKPSLGTSNTYPCGVPVPPPDGATNTVVSAQLIQRFHGVGPPAQFRMVPLRLSLVSMCAPSFVSKTSVVVPPDASGS